MRFLITLAALVAVSGPALTQGAYADFNAVNEAFNAGMAAQDVKGLLELYGPEVMWIAPGTPMSLNGVDEAEKLFQFMTGHKAQVTHDIDHLFVSQDETLAVMIGDVTARVDALDIDGQGTYLYVLGKDAEGWKILGDMWNQVPK